MTRDTDRGATGDRRESERNGDPVPDDPAAADGDGVVGDVDHTHLHTEESFSETGVHDRGKHYPAESADE